MSKVSLVGYSIRIRRAGTKNNYLNLYRFDGNSDLFDVFKQYFSKYSTNGSNSQYAVEDVPNTDNKTISIGTVSNAGSRMLKGVIRTGDYGYKTPIVNHQSKRLSYTRDTEDTELAPLYFLLYVPEKGDIPLENMGIAVFQRFRKNGLKGVFVAHFSNYFAQQFPDYTVEMVPLTPEEVISSFEKGDIKSAQLISHTLTGDLADYYSTNDEDRGRVVLGFEKGSFHHRFIDNLIKILKHELPIKGIIESDWISPDEIKTRVKINGTEKTFTIKEEGTEITPGIDISDNVSFGSDGFPTEQSLNREAVEYVELLKSYLRERNEH